jgi:hypothetical protein
MLQAGKSPARVPDEVDFFDVPNPSTRAMALWSIHPLITVMSTRNFSGGKNGRRVGLTTLPPSVSRMSENVGASTSRKPKVLHDLLQAQLSVCLSSVIAGKCYHILNEATIVSSHIPLDSLLTIIQ